MLSFVFVSLLAVSPPEPPQSTLPPRSVWGFAKPAPAKTFVTKAVVTHQSSATHTHYCSNANCPFFKDHGEVYVWSHSQVKGHVCPYCKTSVPIVNGVYVTGHWPTTVLVTQPALQPTSSQQNVTQPALRTAPVVRQVIRLPQSNCPNGNCPYVR